MAKKKDKSTEDRPDPGGPQTYEVTAKQNLGATITGGPRLAAGASGEITVTQDRYDRLKKQGLIE